MSGAFIRALPETGQIWAAKAIAGIIVADGIVTDEELNVLKESISFLNNKDTINEIVSLVKDRVKPDLEVFKTDRKTSANILLSLGLVAVSDDKLTMQEAQYFNYIAGKLGFGSGYAKIALAWAKEFIVLNKKKNQLISLSEKERPVYVNY